MNTAKTPILLTLQQEAPSFKNASFSKSKYENWILPEKRYVNLIDRAEKRAGIEYLV